MRYLKKDERVRLTTKALKRGLQGRAPTIYGIVTSDQTWPNWLNVRRDGIKVGTRYASSFWERVR